MDDPVILDHLLLLAQLVPDLSHRHSFLLDLFDPARQFPPATLKAPLFPQDLLFEVFDHIKGQIGGYLIEDSRIDCHSLNIHAFVFNFTLFKPALGLHRGLDDFEGGSDVGDFFDDLFKFRHLTAVLIEYFVYFPQIIFRFVFFHNLLKILKFDSFIFDFMQILGRNVIFLHFRRQLPKVELQFPFLPLGKRSFPQIVHKKLLVIDKDIS